MSPPELDASLAALADPTRRVIVELLAQSPLRAGELAQALDKTPAGLSRHLRVLRRGGLVEETSPEHDARVRVYRLRRQPFDELKHWLQDVESYWDNQLASFKAHAEATRGHPVNTTSTPKAKKRRT